MDALKEIEKRHIFEIIFFKDYIYIYIINTRNILL